MGNNPLLCNADDSLLVVIDIQTKLTSVMPIKILSRLQRNSGLLLKAANQLNIPVIASEQYPTGLGSLEAEIIKLLPANTIRIEKTSFSCASNQEFINTLKESGRMQIIIIGMEAHICVLQTAMDLTNLGYSVFVVTDAICSRRREHYETAIRRINNAGVTTCDSESVVFEWLSDSKHEQFKSISKLIRQV